MRKGLTWLDKLQITIITVGTPLIEAGIIIALAQYLGALRTFGLVALSTVAGFVWEGVLWKRFYPEFKTVMQKPRAEQTEGASCRRLDSAGADAMAELMLFLGAFLLFLAPGFLTDGLGFSFLFPPTRRRWKQRLLKKLEMPRSPSSAEPAT